MCVGMGEEKSVPVSWFLNTAGEHSRGRNRICEERGRMRYRRLLSWWVKLLACITAKSVDAVS